MNNTGDDFHITDNIKTIEGLKQELLTQITGLHGCLLDKKSDVLTREEYLANLVITTYLLSSRLGIDCDALDTRILNKLKAEMLKENNDLLRETTLLYKHINNNTNQ